VGRGELWVVLSLLLALAMFCMLFVLVA